MKKVLFIDRNGTLIFEPEDFQIDSFEKLKFLPGMINYLGKIARETAYEFVMISNQDGLGTESFPETAFQRFTILSLKLWQTNELFSRKFSLTAVSRTNIN